MRSTIIVIICLGIFTNTNLLAGDPPTRDLSGRWFWEGRGINTNNDGNGRIVIELEQKGNKLSGDLLQLNGPGSSGNVEDMPSMDKPLFSTSSNLAATIEGEILGPASVNDNRLVILKRFHKDQSHRYELFNIHKDIGETINLAKSNPDKVKELNSLIEQHLAQTSGVVPVANPGYNMN